MLIIPDQLQITNRTPQPGHPVCATLLNNLEKNLIQEDAWMISASFL